MNKRGFTFIELLFVLMITGILVAVAVPRFRVSFDRMYLLSTAGQLQTFMNYIRERAIVDRKVLSLDIDNSTGQYWAQTVEGNKILKRASFPKDMVIVGQGGKIQFYPNGTIDRAEFKVEDKNGNAIGLFAGGYGRVKLQETK